MFARPYQLDAIDAILAAWAAGRASVLAVLATGLGKTVIAAHVIAARKSLGRTMFLAHREELIWQAADKIERVAGVHPAVEMADIHDGSRSMYGSDVVVSTVQTQYAGRNGGRMTRFDPAEFATLIVDEAHHYVSKSYRRVIAHYRQNPNLRVLGITATPRRADDVAMGQVFDDACFNFGIADGIERGWLVHVDQLSCPSSEIDVSDVRTVAGDLSPMELAERLKKEGPLHAIVFPTIQAVGDRKTLVFAADLEHAEMMAEIFNRWRPGSARWVSGETPKDVRKQMFADYARAGFQYLINVGVATEGFDDPGVEAIAIARPTKSLPLFTQMIGRGTRPLPGIVDLYDHADDRVIAIKESEKPACLVLDFVGNSGKHKLVDPADVLGGNYADDVVARAKRKLADEPGKAVDMVEALKAASAEAHAEKERAKATEERRRAELRLRSEYTFEEVNPFDVFQIRPAREAEHRHKPLTPAMRGLLEKHGPKGLDIDAVPFAQAGRMIAEIKRRWDQNLCTVKQADVLRGKNLPTEVTREQASEWMTKLKENRWQVPAELRQYVRPPGAAPRDLAGVEF